MYPIFSLISHLSRNEIQSIHGFLLIEIRTLYPENLCVGSCNFLTQKIYTQTFSAKRISHLIKEKSALRMYFNFSLVIMDVSGNIVSVNFKIDMNTLSFGFCENSVKFID